MYLRKSRVIDDEIRPGRRYAVLITGGGSGIGATMANAFVQNGAKVYIASRKEKQLREVSSVSRGLRVDILFR